MENPAILLRRLNPYCARAMEGAASLCQTRAHAEILPEHWLLKLLEQGEGDLTVLARRYEWDMDSIWQDLLGWLDRQPRSVRHRPQLSDDIQTLMQQAWLLASLNGEEHIRSIHLLMALVEKPKLARCDGLWPLLTLAQSQLERLRPLLDAQSDERPEMQREAELAQNHGGEVEFVGRPAGVEMKEGELSPALQNTLDKFTLDVTAKAKEGKIDPVFGRDTEIRQMVDILSRRRKNNPILVGEPGVGKTALVEGLALRIAEGNVPESLKTVTLRTLDLGLLQAGAGVKGEFEQRLKNVIDAVQHSPSPVLLFIDEAHTIIGAGNQAGGADAANLLKPALARGELRTIAATTWSEYKQYFERDAALERRFQMVKVDEPDDDNACLMLRGLKSRYAEHHHVHITDDAVRAAVTLSRRYLTGRQLPDKAVDLLDTAAARVRMSLDTVPEQLTCIRSQITSLEMEKQALLEDIAVGNQSHGERLTVIEQEENALIVALDELETQYGQELKLTEQLLESRQDISRQSETHALQQELNGMQHSNPLLSLDVDVRTVANVIADWTGVPLSSLMKDEQTELLTLENEMGKRVVGQDVALEAIAQRLRAAKTGLTSENGPQGVFLLVGPSGVGKTETALALADVMYGGEKSLITINLSEYQEPHTVSQLKGSPPGYVGYGQGGILTEAVRKRPYSVVLLDEVEKAHRDVMNLFYQVFDRGFMRDGEGREIDFRNTVILMTSNLGSDHLMQLLDEQPEASEGDLHELLRPILRDHFQPALLARFQTVIYRPLSEAAMRTIVEMKLSQVSKRLHRHYGLSTHIDESLYDALTAACLLPDTGARNVDSLLNQQILPVLSQQLLTHMAAKLKPQSLR
ncbi:type VI secretion system ATPase TssH, partial [Enterobacter roggenkampii]